ncbi:MAG: carboxypeptidase regulatory-like domain-containing protein [Acidimicrobiales bacterium]
MRGLVRGGLVAAVLAASLVVGSGVASAEQFDVTGVVVDPDGNPVEGVDILVYGDAGPAASTVTDGAGQFSLQLDPGTYQYQLWEDGYDASLQSFSVWGDGPVDLGTLELQPLVQITGSVSGPGGAPLENVLVRAYRGTSLAGTAVTGPDGTYVVDGLVDAQYAVWFDAPDAAYIDEWYSDVYVTPNPFGGPTLVTPVQGGGVADAQLEIGRTIAGTVTNADGSPAVGAPVRATVPNGTQNTAVGAATGTDGAGHYVLRGIPTGQTGTDPNPASVTVRVTPPLGGGEVTAGPYAIDELTTITGADVVLPAVVLGTAQLFDAAGNVVPPSFGVGPGVCIDPAVFRPTGPIGCTDGSSFMAFTQRPATQDYRVGPILPGTYTARAASFSGGYGPVATFTVAAGETFHCDLPATGTAVCTVTSADSGDGDGVDAATEDAAPNDGDGNLDNIADSDQPQVASLPDAHAGYLTLAAPEGTELTNVSVFPAPFVPGGVQLETGLITFGVAGLDLGEAIDVEVFLANGTSANSYWKYSPSDGFVNATSIATFSPNKVTLHLVDGGFGDADGVKNGRIQDPGAPGVAETDPPVVTCPTPAPTFHLGELSSLTAAVTDAGAGVASPTVTVPVSTATAGLQSASVPATDLLGNSTTASCPYLVLGYSFGGFQAPVDVLPKVNEAKAGSTVPLKWRLLDSYGVPVSNPASFVSATFKPRPCGSATYDTLEYEAPAAGLKYQGNGEWALGWKTSTGWSGCGDLELRLNDGTIQLAAFRFH